MPAPGKRRKNEQPTLVYTDFPDVEKISDFCPGVIFCTFLNIQPMHSKNQYQNLKNPELIKFITVVVNSILKLVKLQNLICSGKMRKI